MKRVYLDNGATSYPKAPGVAEAMSDYILNNGANVGRGAYESSFLAENIVYETRELIAEMFNSNKSENVVFTKNVTESLNVLIKGVLEAGDHAIVSSMEHNAVMRPLNALSKKDISFSKVKCSNLGELDPDDIRGFIKPNTKAVIMTHASNVCGTILDIETVGRICKEYGLIFIIDTAQTAGFLEIDINRLNADAIAFTGHKGLLGPQGLGGFVVTESLAKSIDTFIEGGTGSLSDQEIQPEYMPDKLEAGTINIPGIYGLNAALKFVRDTGTETIRAGEIDLVERFLTGLKEIDLIHVIGRDDIKNRTGVVSIDVPTRDNADISYKLYSEYGIATRCGMHCAPSAHQTLGTFPKGTVRFSFSHFNTIEDVDYALGALNKILY
ncbi:aminotransferase class V-fold PLP-dependent enzyme [Gudongella oleilytica]|uniref:aminotransferase class V-fold PLP-dependent enzyme n=1 Tax=Gudongella oleilytica TaxID=1582259 RepID=UPI000FF8957B|nr:aminotransferase class V-fold PLP-dependent enzyme [Gudongella oleilytica]